RESKFGFGILEPLRKSFCNTFCTSVGAAYVVNLACAVKCPELYLPHETTTKSTTMLSSSLSTSSSSSKPTEQTNTPTTAGSTTQSTTTTTTSTTTRP
ncbi:hypothetical protein WH47_08018, partial [Habropoda laboriosa]